jgi:predicted transposase/invertase (TIGR01784 family)
LTNFDKSETELTTNLDKWVYLLKNMHLLDKLPEFLNEGIFQKVFNITEMSKLTKEERIRYEMDLRAKSNYEGGIAYSIEKGVDKAMIDVAKKLKSRNISFLDISEATSLSIEEIEKL